MITKEEIKKISSLAKINISNDQLDNYSEQVSKILEYMSQLEEVDTSEVDECSDQFLNDDQSLREDEIIPSLDRDVVLNLAPDSDGVYFKVPKVISEEEE
tara:strand:- start:60 stop:359 length:300 start_codon:yes stop_codon:yes gene_type:complete